MLAAYTVLSINAVDFAWNATGSNLRHSHVWLSYPRWLSHLLISPAMHQVHHSADPRHHDKNLGNIFALWDWLFGTLYLPERVEPVSFGLGDAGAGHETLRGLYARPFVDAWAWLCGRGGRARRAP